MKNQNWKVVRDMVRRQLNRSAYYLNACNSITWQNGFSPSENFFDDLIDWIHWPQRWLVLITIMVGEEFFGILFEIFSRFRTGRNIELFVEIPMKITFKYYPATTLLSSVRLEAHFIDHYSWVVTNRNLDPLNCSISLSRKVSFLLRKPRFNDSLWNVLTRVVSDFFLDLPFIFCVFKVSLANCNTIRKLPL